MEQNEISVWDPFVRIFHWSLVLTFTIAWFSGDELEVLHINAGYAVLGLVLLRLVWGFVGTHHARFRNFVYPPAEVKGCLRDTLRQRARRYLGHNPAGGAGPLAMLAGMPEAGEEMLEEVHEFFANLTVLLVVVHVIGVIFESRFHHESLIKAMLTGRKRA